MTNYIEILKSQNSEFAEKIIDVLEACKNQDAEMRPYCFIRDPWTQAKLWRQSRTKIEIDRMINKLKQENARFLAEILDSVGPQSGRWATNCVPGSSWHQWGKAVDCFAVGGCNRAIWTAKHKSYSIYAEEAKKRGLMAGFHWNRVDAVHVQESSYSVRGTYTWEQISHEMENRYGKTDSSID